MFWLTDINNLCELGHVMNNDNTTTTMKTQPVYYAVNRKNNTAVILSIEAFPNWAFVQAAFGMGIQLPDGSRATGIGRCGSEEEFYTRAEKGGTKVLTTIAVDHRKVNVSVTGTRGSCYHVYVRPVSDAGAVEVSDRKLQMAGHGIRRSWNTLSAGVALVDRDILKLLERAAA